MAASTSPDRLILSALALPNQKQNMKNKTAKYKRKTNTNTKRLIFFFHDKKTNYKKQTNRIAFNSNQQNNITKHNQNKQRGPRDFTILSYTLLICS